MYLHAPSLEDQQSHRITDARQTQHDPAENQVCQNRLMLESWEKAVVHFSTSGLSATQTA
jgi:hypothetical protein